jgi:hypothetical protein
VQVLGRADGVEYAVCVGALGRIEEGEGACSGCGGRKGLEGEAEELVGSWSGAKQHFGGGI